MIRTRIKAAAAVAMTAAAAGGAVALAAAPAHATTGYNINGWNESACTNTYRANYCLWYSQGGQGGGWAGYSQKTDLDQGQVFNIGGGAGEGQYVLDNAASMSNGTTDCHVAVWDDYGEQGNYVNWLSPGYGGDLTSQLRNQDVSIDENTCS
jgi:hypothetical protein